MNVDQEHKIMDQFYKVNINLADPVDTSMQFSGQWDRSDFPLPAYELFFFNFPL